ncbi:hypothetical protein EDE11_104143 [Methylomonas methanica]|uniref:Uncharacterized protein n=1 Tax=Methylomonas methanica TaxID=421 RepID=A0ABY2CPY8_METMH|nr:hypothetical protein EDE11_104143 [Methylomonas methanica]
MNKPIEIAQENPRRDYVQITQKLPKPLIQKEDNLFSKKI